MIRIIIADDAPLMTESLKLILEKDSELEVVGIARNGMEALNLCDALLPDVVLMDIVMPVCDGIEGTRLIKSKHPEIKILMLTTFEDEDKISRALNNGADGYLLKDVSPDALRSSLKSVNEGLPIVHPKVLHTILKHFDDSNLEIDSNDSEKVAIYNSLSEREKSITDLVVQGKNNREIASDVCLSEGRVKNIISEILGKLGMEGRTQLAVFAIKNKLNE